MFFLLTNTPTIFQHLMNDVFHEFLNKFVKYVFRQHFDLFQEYGRTQKNVKLVLQKIQDIGLYAKLEKCVFHQPQVKFLGYIISNKGLLMDLKKIQVITNWSTPQMIRDV